MTTTLKMELLVQPACLGRRLLLMTTTLKMELLVLCTALTRYVQLASCTSARLRTPKHLLAPLHWYFDSSGSK
jgi:hypothetical protein